MTTWTHQTKSQEITERKALVNAKATFDDVVVALDLGADGVREKTADCPFCNAVGELRSCHGGKGFYCGDCSATGDMIDLVRAARNCGFVKAIEVLEDELTASPDRETIEMFA